MSIKRILILRANIFFLIRKHNIKTKHERRPAWNILHWGNQAWNHRQKPKHMQPPPVLQTMHPYECMYVWIHSLWRVTLHLSIMVCITMTRQLSRVVIYSCLKVNKGLRHGEAIIPVDLANCRMNTAFVNKVTHKCTGTGLECCKWTFWLRSRFFVSLS